MSNNSETSGEAIPETIQFQVRAIPTSGASPQAVQDALKAITAEQLKAAGAIVGQVSHWLLDEVGKLAKAPESLTVEFGIDVQGEAGVPFVTKGSVGANFRVSLEWKASK